MSLKKITLLFNELDVVRINVATSGTISQRLDNTPNGATLYLQADGKLGTNNSYVISKEVGIQTIHGIVVGIKKETSTNNIYTSYQDNTGLKIFDAVRLTDKGTLEKSINTSLLTSEVFGVVSKLETGIVQVVTSGFVEGNSSIENGTVLFLQADGSIGANKVGIVEKAVAVKVPRGIYVDIKLGVERQELSKGGTSKTSSSEKESIPVIKITSEDKFSKGTHVGIDSNGDYKVFAKGLTYVGMVKKTYLGKTNRYQVVTSGFVPYTDVSLKDYINAYGCRVKVANKVYFSEDLGLPPFNNIGGQVTLMTCLKEGVLLNYREVVVEKQEIVKQEEEVKRKEYNLERGKYYECTTLSLTLEDLIFFENKGYSKLMLINNSGVLFGELVAGKMNVILHKYQGKFILQPLNFIL